MPLAELNGQTIRIARAVRKMSQRELGQASGITSHRIWAIENGVYQPTPEEWARIWRALTTE